MIKSLHIKLSNNNSTHTKLHLYLTQHCSYGEIINNSYGQHMQITDQIFYLKIDKCPKTIISGGYECKWQKQLNLTRTTQSPITVAMEHA